MISPKKVFYDNHAVPKDLSSFSLPPSSSYTHNLVAIIPAYNESLVIGSVVLQTRCHVDQVIVIDDGSNDNTAKIARLAGADVIEMPKNGGKAQAMMAGFNRAKELGYDFVVVLDGDGHSKINKEYESVHGYHTSHQLRWSCAI